MNQNVTIKGMDELMRYVREIPANMHKHTKDEFSKAAFAVHKNLTDAVSGTRLQRRTGQLARSFQPRVYGDSLATMGASVFTTSPYAPIHEKGGTVRAKRAYTKLQGGPYLNIPTEANKTPAGVMRQSARDVFTAGARIVKLKSGKAKFMIISKVTNKPMFWLVKQVGIKARLGMEKEATDYVPTLLSNLRRMTQYGIE